MPAQGRQAVEVTVQTGSHLARLMRAAVVVRTKRETVPALAVPVVAVPVAIPRELRARRTRVVAVAVVITSPAAEAPVVPAS